MVSDSEEEEAGPELECFGYITDNIVGLQYYEVRACFACGAAAADHKTAAAAKAALHACCLPAHWLGSPHTGGHLNARPLRAALCPQGEVNQNEMVLLVREPENAYDAWAVRVDNVEHVKVGHLPRVLVCHVSVRYCCSCCRPWRRCSCHCSRPCSCSSCPALSSLRLC